MRTVGVRCAVFLSLILVGTVGCVNTQPLAEQEERSQRDKDLDVGLVGDVTEVGNVMPLKVHGVALVTGLDGTGDSPPGVYRTLLENELRKKKIEGVKD